MPSITGHLQLKQNISTIHFLKRKHFSDEKKSCHFLSGSSQGGTCSMQCVKKSKLGEKSGKSPTEIV